MSYMPHNFANGDIIEAGPINEMDQQIQTNETNIGAKLNKSDVYNGLDYTDEGKALDARQGKALSQAVGGKIDSTEKGAANGIAELGSDGKVPSSQLPSYVDDVLEFASSSVFPLTGESGKIYIALDTNKTYRWSGSTYAPVGNDLALGETSSTAYRGDRGKIAYNHATDNGRMTTAQASGLYKIATTEEGHVASVMAVAKSDITALGIPGQDTTYSDMTGATPSTAGTEGLVPAPAAGDQDKALFGDGTWKEVADPSDMTGATAQQGGAHGLVPAPAAGDQDKALFGDGTWKTVSVEDPDDFTGATASTAGAHGLVPAPAAGDQTKVLTGDGTWKVSPGAKVYEKTVTITNTSGAYGQTFTDENISADMKAVELEVNRSYVFGDSIIITPNDGSVTVACNDVAGTDTIKISLIKVIDDPTAVTSTEFTILNNRIGNLASLETTDKTSMVNAVNEVVDAVSDNTQDIETLNSNSVALARHTRKTDFALADLQAAVVEQNLAKYGLKPGDQKTINGYTYVIAGLNEMKGTHSYTCTSNHVALIVISHTTQAWNASGHTYEGADGRGAGYLNSDLHYYLTNTVLPHVQNDLGSGHLYAHRKLLTNAVNQTGYNRFGTNSGCSSGWTWTDPIYIAALSEVQVYGSTIWSSSGHDTGETCKQLAVFKEYKNTDIFGNEYPWLRDVVSASHAALSDYGGYAGNYGASHAYHVAGLILYH